MKCVTPLLRAYHYGNYSKGHIVSKQELSLELQKDNNRLKTINRLNRITRKKGYGLMYEEIPCGKCYGCRLSYAADWATLMMCEKMYYPEDECWFITLTYDDTNITIPNSMTMKWNDFDEVAGKEQEYEETYKNDGTWTGTLVEEDMQKFIKRVRKHFPNKDVKYFYCGEYGTGTNRETATLRPHYHIILFGTPWNPKEFYDHHIDKDHKWHNKSHELDRLWNMSWQTDEDGILNGKSIIDMAKVEWSSCGYVARYCMKKVGDTWNDEEWYKIGKIPEFVRMSRTIGDRYYEDHKDEIWKNDNIVFKTVKGNIGTVKPPRKFMRKLEKEEPWKALQVKRKRRELIEKINISKEQTDTYNDLEQLIMKADNLQTKSKMLKREM